MFIAALCLSIGLGAWWISTIAAGGAASLALPLLGLLLGAEIAIPAVALGAMVANPGRAWLFRRHIEWPLARWLIPGSLLGGFVGGAVFSLLDPRWLQGLLGAFLLSTGLQQRWSRRHRFPALPAWCFFPLGLAVSGISGVVGASGPVLNPFLLHNGIDRARLVATKAINSLVMQWSKLVAYGSFGALSGQVLEAGLALGLGALLGTAVARRHLLSISAERFKLYALALMHLAGAALLATALGWLGG